MTELAPRSQPVSLDDVSWRPSYDRPSIERFLAGVDGERSRLQHEIDVRAARTVFARARVAAREAEARSTLAAMVAAANAEISRLEEEHLRAVDVIRTAARAEEREACGDRAIPPVTDHCAVGATAGFTADPTSRPTVGCWGDR